MKVTLKPVWPAGQPELVSVLRSVGEGWGGLVG